MDISLGTINFRNRTIFFVNIWTWNLLSSTYIEPRLYLLFQLLVLNPR